MDLIKQIETKYIPQWIPYPEGETTQREEMSAYERYTLLYHSFYSENLTVFI